MSRKKTYNMQEVQRMKDVEYGPDFSNSDQTLTYEDETDNTMFLELYRKSHSRFRHLNNEKSKKRAKSSAVYLSSKLNKLSFNATSEENFRLCMRALAAEKKAARFK